VCFTSKLGAQTKLAGSCRSQNLQFGFPPRNGFSVTSVLFEECSNLESSQIQNCGSEIHTAACVRPFSVFSSNSLGVCQLAYERGNTLLQKTRSTTEFGETAWGLLCNLSFVLDVVRGVRDTILQWIRFIVLTLVKAAWSRLRTGRVESVQWKWAFDLSVLAVK
jgi:hypothetical protein